MRNRHKPAAAITDHGIISRTRSITGGSKMNAVKDCAIDHTGVVYLIEYLLRMAI
jgi:hypothetical protein